LNLYSEPKQSINAIDTLEKVAFLEIDS